MSNKINFIDLYEELNSTWNNDILLESFIEVLRKGNEKDEEALSISVVEARNMLLSTKFSFLQDSAFDDYFNYLEDRFKANNNCRYLRDKAIIDKRDLIQGPLILDAHHIVFKSLGGSNEISNLIALLRSEHLEAHTKFIDCLNNYIQKAPKEDLDRLFAVATKSVQVLSRQGKDATEILVHQLKAEGEQEGKSENNGKSLNTQALINKIDAINFNNMLGPMYREKQGGKENLKRPDTDCYEVTFADGTVVKNIEGIKGVIETIRDKNKTGITPTEGEIKPCVITVEQRDAGEVPKRAKKNIDGSRSNVSKKAFTRFNLRYPDGVCRITDKNNSNSRAVSEPIICFPVSRELQVDYSKGLWFKSPNTVRTVGFGVIDEAYSRAVKTRENLKLGLRPAAMFKSTERDKEGHRQNYIFMFAGDIELLKKVITEQERRLLQIRKYENDELWYPKQD